MTSMIFFKLMIVCIFFAFISAWILGRKGIGPEDDFAINGIKLPAWMWAFGPLILLILSMMLYFLLFVW